MAKSILSFKNYKTMQGLGSLIYHFFVEKSTKGNHLAGWRDDKEKFKIDLINDIKSFLFTNWEKPWRPSLIFDKKGEIISGFRNVSGRVYRKHDNIIMLSKAKGESPYFITIPAIEKQGGKIIEKNKTVRVLSYVPVCKEKECKEKGKPDFMLPKFHKVINVDFVEGIKKPTYKKVEFQQLELNEYIENFINELKRLNRIPKLIYDEADRCYYKSNPPLYDIDEIHLVNINSFKNIGGYYSTLFHEITHSTKNYKRLGRGGGKNNKLPYANEELVAEMGAMIICSELGLEYEKQNSLSYLKGWLSEAGSDVDMSLIEAYSYACAAAEYLFEDIDLKKLIPESLSKRVEKQNETKPEKPVKTDVEKPKETQKPETKPIEQTGTSNGRKLSKDEIENVKKTVERAKAKIGIEKSAKVDVIDFPIKDIYTDEKRFQNRQNAFSDDSKNRIIEAYKRGLFDWAKFDPIVIWFDKLKEKYFVLSGHSRLAAFKELSKMVMSSKISFSKIPAKIFKGTEAEAIDLALNSNTLATKETEVERALYYNKARQACEVKKGLSGRTDCEKQVETQCRETEGKNANYILNLSYLNPNGFLMTSLANLGIERDNDNTNILRTIANWIGEARKALPISDIQENEISKFLINGGYGNRKGQFSNKTAFLEKLKYAYEKWQAKGGNEIEALNLQNLMSKSDIEREYDERLISTKKELDNAIAEHKEKYNKYLFAVIDGKITQERMDELMKPIIALVDKRKKEYDFIRNQKENVIKASNAQSSLFGLRKRKNKKTKK